MVGLEAGQLEVAIDAVAAVERLDRAHQLVLAGGVGAVSTGGIDISEVRDRCRERKTGDEWRQDSGGAVQITPRREHACQPVLGHAVVGEVAQRAPVGRLGQVEVAAVEVEVADERAHVRRVGRGSGAGRGRLGHCRNCARWVAAQLAYVGDAREAGQ